MKKDTDIKYEKLEMNKDLIVEKLRKKGCRITKQRLAVLDTILEHECASCKEIYYLAASDDPGLGIATVYRTINLLEEIGAISRKNMYAISGEMSQNDCKAQCRSITLEDGTQYFLSPKKWQEVILAGLKAYGYID